MIINRIEWCWHWENEVNSQRGDADAIHQNERCLWQSTWFQANDETDRLPLSSLTQGINKQYQGPKIWVRNCPFPFWKVLEFRLCNMVHFAPKVSLVYSIFQKFCAQYLASKGNLLWVHWTMSFSFNPNFISIWRTRERLPERTKPHSRRSSSGQPSISILTLSVQIGSHPQEKRGVAWRED